MARTFFQQIEKQELKLKTRIFFQHVQCPIFRNFCGIYIYLQASKLSSIFIQKAWFFYTFYSSFLNNEKSISLVYLCICMRAICEHPNNNIQFQLFLLVVKKFSTCKWDRWKHRRSWESYWMVEFSGLFDRFVPIGEWIRNAVKTCLEINLLSWFCMRKLNYTNIAYAIEQRLLCDCSKNEFHRIVENKFR